MAQDIYWSWQDNDSTFRMNQRDLLLIPHGLYFGFDPDLSDSDMTFRLNHNETGVTRIDQALIESVKLGLFRTKQGGLIHEDAEVELSISVGDSTHPRIDLIIVDHAYEEVTGGAPAIYQVIEGTPSATPVAPTLTDANRQVILGYLTVPNAVTSVQDCTYEKALSPAFGNDSTSVKTYNVVSAGIETIQEAKGKIFDIVVQKVGTASISGASLELDSLKGKYVLEQTALTYIQVTGVSLLNFTGDLASIVGAEFLIQSAQRLRLTTGSNFVFETDNTLTDAFVEAGESFIIALQSVSLGVPSYTIRLSERTLRGKEYGVKSGFLTTEGYDEPTSSLSLSKGNVIAIPNDDAANTLAFIQRVFNDHYLGAEGIVIYLYNSGSANLLIENEYTPVPTGYSGIKTGSGNNEVLKPNELIELILIDGKWLFNVGRNYLSTLLDTQTVAYAGNQILVCTDFGGGVIKWVNVDLQTKLQSTNHFMQALFSVYCDQVTLPLTSTVSGVPFGAFNPSDANHVRIAINSSTITKIGGIRLDDTKHPIGSELKVTWTGNYTPAIVLNCVITNPNYGNIQCNGYGVDKQVEQPIGTTWTFLRTETGWEYLPLAQKARRGAWREWYQSAISFSTIYFRTTASGSLATPIGTGLRIMKNEFGEVRIVGGRLYVIAGAIIDSAIVITTIPTDFRPTEAGFTNTDNILMFSAPCYNRDTAGQQRMIYFTLNKTNGGLRLLSHVGNNLFEFDVIDFSGVSWLADYLDN